MSTLNIQEAKNILSMIFTQVVKNDEIQPPVALHSQPGVGKSAIVREIVEDMKQEHGKEVGFRDLRLSGMESSDVQGIPHVHPETHQMEFSTPAWFPNEEEEPYGILFLDELPNADIDTQKAGYRIVHDRTIQNGKKLPDGWLVVMAGNRKEDKTGVNRLLPALANRFGSHIDVVADSKAFIEYALGKGLHSAVIGFLMEQPQFVHKFDPNNKEDHSFPSPRSWEFVSNYLNMFGQSTDSTEIDDELSVLIQGAIGNAASVQFMAHLRYHHRLPNLDKIARGEKTYEVSNKEDVGFLYALTSNLTQKVGEYRDNEEALKNFVKLIKQMDNTYAILLLKNVRAFGTHVMRGLLHDSPLREVYEENVDYLKRVG